VAQSKFCLFTQGVSIGLGLTRAIIEKIEGIIGFNGSQNIAKKFWKEPVGRVISNSFFHLDWKSKDPIVPNHAFAFIG
jgi:hypothetical protein